MQVAAFLLRKLVDDVIVQIDTDGAGESERFVTGERGRPEGVPREDEERRRRIEIGVGLEMGQLFQTPALHLATGGVEGVLRGGCVGVPFFLIEQHLLPPATALRRRLARRAALERPVAGELFERRPKEAR